MTTTSIKIGERVSPANNGEDSSGKVIRWTKLRGTVKAIYPPIGREEREQGITRVEDLPPPITADEFSYTMVLVRITVHEPDARMPPPAGERSTRITPPLAIPNRAASTAVTMGRCRRGAASSLSREYAKKRNR